MTRKGLEEAARRKAESSGLSKEEAKRLRFEVLTAEQVASIRGEAFAKVGALRLPYFDPDGKPSGFYRLRYLETLPGFAGASEKPQRYAQPKGTLNEVYLPPILADGRRWRDVLRDAETPIYITEGELKAAAGCSAGLATIGLGGVDVWRSTKRGIELLPTLAETEWNGRTVVIVYDSDAATNPNVVRAELRLAERLTALGALPAVASLPPTKDGGKVGLDDYLVAEGAEALRALCAEAPVFAEAAALWGMNEEVAYVRDPGMVVERATGQKWKPSDFTGHAYANRHFFTTKQTAKGAPVLVKAPLAKHWMEWERRFELKRVTYAPGRPPLHEEQWNEWRGWGVEPRKGDVAPWRWLMDFIFSGERDPEVRRWFERWCAYPLQHPGAKLFSAAVLWGVFQGTGKTLVGHSLLRIYGPNGQEIKDKDLDRDFNGWAQNKQFVLGDEVTGNDRRDKADRLKGMITQRDISINVKYLPEYSVPDCVNYLFTSNHPDAFFLEDADRRFFIHEVVSRPARQREYDAYDKWYKSEAGAAALFDYLLRLDLGDFNPHAPALSTRAKEAMIRDNKSDLGLWVASLRDDPERTLRVAFGERAANGAALFSAEQLLRAYDPEGATKATPNGLSRELKRAGFRQAARGEQVPTSAGRLHLYAVRAPERFVLAPKEEAAEAWEEFFGPKAKKF